MKKLAVGCLVGLLAGVVIAGTLERQILTITTPTNITWYASDSTTAIRGWIEEIAIDDVTGNAVTGTLSVIVSEESTTATNLTALVSAFVCSNDFVFRPRFDVTDSAGTLLTSDPPERYAIFGQSVLFSGTNWSATNKQFKATIKYEKSE